MWDWGVLPAFQKTLWGKPVTNVINLQFQSQSPKTIFYLVHTKFLSFKYQMFYKNSKQNSWSFKNYSIRSVLTSLGCFLMTRYSSKCFLFSNSCKALFHRYTVSAPSISKLWIIFTFDVLSIVCWPFESVKAHSCSCEKVFYFKVNQAMTELCYLVQV